VKARVNSPSQILYFPPIGEKYKICRLRALDPKPGELAMTRVKRR
jgi:hypothetical protein